MEIISVDNQVRPVPLEKVRVRAGVIVRVSDIVDESLSITLIVIIEVAVKTTVLVLSLN